MPDIRIREIESDNILKTDKIGEYDIPITLSYPPPNEWVDIFEAKWQEFNSDKLETRPLRNLTIIENTLLATVSHDLFNSGPFDRFNFTGTRDIIGGLVADTNEAYNRLMEKQAREIAALKQMVEKVKF